MFRRFCTPTSCFVPSLDTRPPGVAMAFSIRLLDGTALLRGEGVVLDAWKTADNPFKRPGVHLGIHRLTQDSAAMFEALLVPRSVVAPLALGAQLRMLNAVVPGSAVLETPTVQMSPLELPTPERVPIEAFAECSLDDERDAIPGELAADATIPNAATPATVAAAAAMAPGRDAIETLLGMMPIEARVYAAPELVVTELVDRVAIPTSIIIARDRWWQRSAGRLRRWWIAATGVRLRRRVV